MDSANAYLVRMEVQNFAVLPPLLRGARLAAKLSQKAVAVQLEIDQSHWCGIEKGRRPLPREGALQRFAVLVRATASAAEEMHWAATHDRIVAQALKEKMPEPAVALLSKCLRAARVLSTTELQGLLATVDSAIASKQELQHLARRARSANEEAAMQK
jgi:transcriptional regulator with XRE-family HTH domain